MGGFGQRVLALAVAAAVLLTPLAQAQPAPEGAESPADTPPTEFYNDMVATPAQAIEASKIYEVVIYYGSEINGASSEAIYLTNGRDINTIALAAPEGGAPPNCALLIIDGFFSNGTIVGQAAFSDGSGVFFAIKHARDGIVSRNSSCPSL